MLQGKQQTAMFVAINNLLGSQINNQSHPIINEVWILLYQSKSEPLLNENYGNVF